MTTKKTEAKPKYNVGDVVLVKITIDEIYDDEDWEEAGSYGARVVENRNTYGRELTLDEEDIIGLAPIEEPEAYGAIVEVDGKAYTQMSDDTGTSCWVCHTIDSDVGFTWQQLLKMGTPKVIWEPQS